MKSRNVIHHRGYDGAVFYSVEKEIEDLRHQFFNVRNFGATGDGSTDDTAAIQAAIDAAEAAGGGLVFFPRGSYRVSSVTVDNDDVFFMGAGQGVSIIVATSATANVIAVSSSEKFGFAGLTIATAVTRTAGSYLSIDGTAGVYLREFNFISPFKGVTLTDTSLVHIDTFDIVGPRVTDGVGIYIDGGNDYYIRDGIVRGDPANEPRAGYEVAEAGAVYMDDAHAIDTGVGMILLAGNTATIENIFTSRCAFDSCGSHGWLIQANAGGVVRRVVSAGDWVASNGANGLTIAGAGTVQALSFLGLRALNNVGHGVQISAGVDVDVSHSQIAGNSEASAATYSGICVDANVNSFRFIGNRSGPIAGFSDTQKYGIEIAAGTSNKYVITGNDLHGNGTPLLDSGTGTEKVVDNNLPLSTTAWISFTPTVTATAGTFTTTSADGRYKKRGKSVELVVRVTITTVGTGTLPKFSLPFAANGSTHFTMFGRELAATGVVIVATVQPGASATDGIADYKNADIAASGTLYCITGVYEAA